MKKGCFQAKALSVGTEKSTSLVPKLCELFKMGEGDFTERIMAKITVCSGFSSPLVIGITAFFSLLLKVFEITILWRNGKPPLP